MLIATLRQASEGFHDSIHFISRMHDPLARLVRIHTGEESNELG